MNVFLIWLGLMGVVGLLAAGCALCVWLERKVPVKRFDERQQEARGKGYRFGFWVGIAYNIILWIAAESADIGARDMGIWALAGVFLTLLSSEMYMMMTGAMLPFAQKFPVFLTVGYLATGAVWLHNAISDVSKQQALFGQHSIPWMELIISIAFFSMGLLYFIDWMKRRRSNDGE